MTPAALALALACSGPIGFVDGDTILIACQTGVLEARIEGWDAGETRACTQPPAPGQRGCVWCGDRASSLAARDRHRAALDALRAALGALPGDEGVFVDWRHRYFDRNARSVGDGVIAWGLWRGWWLSEAIIAAGQRAGVETLRPWPHDAGGAALQPQPDWCIPEQPQ